MAKRAEQLLELAQAEFGQLSVVEERLFRAVVEGETADYSVGDKEIDNPANASTWGDDRTLKSNRLIWLCTESQVKGLLTFRGINLSGIKIQGDLNLEFARIDFPLFFSKSVFTHSIFLRQAKAVRLELEGSHVVSIDASLIKIDGSLVLSNGFQSDNLVDLTGAIIAGNINCEGGKFVNPKGDALKLASVNISASIRLCNGFEAEGRVNLSGAIIGGSLDCQDGKFVGKDKYAISLEGAKIAGSVFFRKNPQPVSAQMQGFHVEGLVRLFRATIGGNLECQNGKFINPQGDSINAEGTDIKGSILLRNGFEADGGVRIFGATIGGDLDCQDGKFVGKDKYAISLEGAKVAGNVLFRKTLQAGNEQIQGFQAEGTVHLLGATIGRNLICDGGKFINPQGDSINAEGTDIKGSVYFRNGFEANGGVRMFGATIGGDLDCQNGKFVGRDRYAVSLEGARVSNNVLFRKTLQSESEQIQGFQAEGEVRLFRANIGRDLDCYGGKFINPQGYTINAQNANIKGIIFLGEGFESEGTVSLVNAKIDDSIMIFGVSNSEKMSLDLRFSRLRILVDHEDSWMQKGKIYLNDCVYDTISHESPRDAQRRLDWLRLQDLKEEFSPQPYEQLAKVLRSLGHENDAIQVLIAKQEDRLRYGKISILGKIWQGLLGLTIAHGYKPHRALLFAIIFVLYGGLLFDAADSLGWISHSKCEVKTSVSTSSLSQLPKEYPKFNAYIYSLDLFLPIVDLRQKNNWQPNSNTGYEILIPLLKVQWRSVVQYYFYLHILLGWLLTTLWVAGVTGLVRRLN